MTHRSLGSLEKKLMLRGTQLK